MAKKATSYLNRLSSLSLLQDSSTRTSLAISAIALLSFLALAIVLPSKDSLLNQLFPKPKTHAATASATDWPQLQYNAQHIGYTSVEVPPPYQATWVWMDPTHIVHNFVSQPGASITDGFADKSTYKQSVLFDASMQPIVVQNTVIFGANNGTEYAVDAATGNNKWNFPTGGPIMSTAASDGSTVVITSMDGKVYGLNAVSGPTNGQPIWTFATGAGINASPVINNGVVYIGSRDGNFYALDITTGAKKWQYTTRVEPADSTSPYNKAPIESAAAISEDGSTVFFGAENTFLYALNTADGSEKWAPKKLNGQSFQHSWPVVKGNLVIVISMSSEGTTESNLESVLDSLPATPTWQQERDAINSWLNANPAFRLVRVFNVADGTEPFQPAMGPYAPFGNPYVPPVVDGSGRILYPYWRVKDATFFQLTGTYGTKYGLDLSVMDPTTGDRITIPNSQTSKLGPEIDNVFNVTVGGNTVYMQEAFRGMDSVNLATGLATRGTAALADWDGGDNRGWGYNIIYYGNDSTPTVDIRPPTQYNGFSGLGAGVSLANISGTPMLFINESDVVGIVGVTHKP